jgi:hypothetical protein
MSESAVPKTWADARNLILGNAPWILLLVAVERAIEGHFAQAGVALVLCFLSLGIAIHWNAFEGLGTRKGRRRLAFVIIAIGAICLAVGIYLLASPPPPVSPIAEVGKDQITLDDPARSAIDRQLATTRSELQATLVQRDTLQAEVEKLKKQAPSPNRQALTTSSPIIWNLDGQLIVASGSGQSAVINGIILQGTSTAFLRFKEAYLRSELTGHHVLLKANVQQLGAYFPVAKVDVPANAPVQLDAMFDPPLSIKDFFNEWGKFRFFVTYDDNTRFENEFDEAHVRARVQQQAPNAFGPRVTPREDK